MKLSAAMGLVKAGVFRENEDIPLLLDGKRQLVRINKAMVSKALDDEAKKLYENAVRLRAQGKNPETILLLQGMFDRGVTFPPALLMLANLYRTERMPDKAKMLLDMLESIDPDNPFFLFNMAGFWLENGEISKATACPGVEVKRPKAGLKMSKSGTAYWMRVSRDNVRPHTELI